MEELLNSQLREFYRLYKEESDIYREIAQRLGSCNSAVTILYDLCSLGEGCTQKDICDSSFLSKQTVNSSIRKLESLGHIYLEKGKGRNMHIYLTDSGHALVEEKILPVMRMEARAFSSLGEDGETMVRLFRQYLASFRREVDAMESSR